MSESGYEGKFFGICVIIGARDTDSTPDYDETVDIVARELDKIKPDWVSIGLQSPDKDKNIFYRIWKDAAFRTGVPLVTQLQTPAAINREIGPIWSTERALAGARLMDSGNPGWNLTATGSGGSENISRNQFKTVDALCSEAAVVISCGGSFSVSDAAGDNGRPVSWHMDDIADVARFCRSRQPYGRGTVSVRQVAVMNATGKTFLHTGDTSPEVDGALHAFLDCGFHTDILTENKMLELASEYPVCVVPEYESIPGSTVDALLRYVENGGNLIISGAESTKRFDLVMGAEDTGKTIEWDELVEVAVPYRSGSSTLIGEYRLVRNDTAEEIKPILLTRHRGENEKRTGSPIASMQRYGNGKITCIYGPVFESYGNSHYFGIAGLTADIMDSMKPASVCRADLPSGVHMTLRECGNRLFVHFVNLKTDKSLSYRNTMTGEIPEAGPIRFSLALTEKPGSIYLAPTAEPVDWSFAGGTLNVLVPRVRIHDILVIERVLNNG